MMRTYTTGLTRNNVPSNPNISQFEYLRALKLQKSHDEISKLSTFKFLSNFDLKNSDFLP